MFLLSNILIFSYAQLFFGEIISRFLKRPTSDFRLPTSDLRLPSSDLRLATSVFRLPTSNFRLPTSDFRLPTSDFRLPTSDFRLQTSHFRLPTSDFYWRQRPNATCAVFASYSPRSRLFFADFFRRPFRLSLAPTICPWVSEDVFADLRTENFTGRG